jgi:type I restriction enzyme R subunit
MRHLIDTYIRADEARTISQLGDVGLLDLIVKSGITEALNSLPPGVRADRNAVAETIANNDRSRIMREHLHDPAFYDRMSTLLAQILEDLKAKRLDYESFLQRIAALAAQVQAGQADDTPLVLRKSPGMRAMYNALVQCAAEERRVAEERRPYAGTGSDPHLDLAQRLDERLRVGAPDGWRGVLAKEKAVKQLIFGIVGDTALVERLFPVIKAQAEY